MILIPAVDIQDGRCVRLVQGRADSATVYDDSPLAAVRRWANLDAGLIHVVDLDGAFSGEPKNRDAIRQILSQFPGRIQVAGGIRTQNDVDFYISSGAERLVLGTKAVEDPNFLPESVKRHGGRIWVGLDAREGRVMVKGWTSASGAPLSEVARQVNDSGAGGVIFTDIRRDGMLSGPNLEAVADLKSIVMIPLVASGGVSKVEDLLDLARVGGLHGVIVGKALYTGAVDFALATARLRSGAGTRDAG